MKLSELKKRMKGIVTVQLTPFNDDGSVDLDGFRANTRWLAEKVAGKDFIFTPVGSTGEFYAMSTEECKDVIKACVEETKGRAIIMAGAARAGTIETIKMIQYAESAGCDGVQSVIPYYHIPFEEGMYAHYKAVCENVGPDFGITVYNNPGVSGSWIKPALMQKISKLPNVVAVKENTNVIADYYNMRRMVDPDDTVILCGIGELMYSFEALYGCPGFISTISNFAPHLPYSIYEAAMARNFDKVTEIVKFMQPYFSFIVKCGNNHAPHTGNAYVPSAQPGYIYISIAKAAMDLVGLRGGHVRLPLSDLTEKEKDELKEVLKAIKVI